MSLTLYAHPFSSYCQKVLVALYENATPFAYRMLGPEDPAAGAEWVKLWPMKKMPVLVDGETPSSNRASSSNISACSILGRSGWYRPTRSRRWTCA